ncbi:MAG TPA: hypothetical protein PLL10_10830, partial [Elusimicrobiales bacterium]|nr:hypothetical protein [Elusimicrobiales bacterium]
LQFAMQGSPLLEKKVIVDKAVLSGLRFSTPRKTSGALPFAPKKEESAVEKKMKAMGASLAGFGASRLQDMKSSALTKIDISPDSLESVRLAKEQQAKITAEAATWKNELQGQALQGRIDGLKAKVSALDKEGDAVKKIQQADILRKEIAAVKNELAEKNKRFSAFMEQSKSALAGLDAARQRDVAAAMQRFNLPSFDGKALTMALLGPEIGPRLGKGLYWYGKLRKSLPEGKAKPEPRSSGTWVYFPKEKSYPSFAIAEMGVDGQISLQDSPLELAGSIFGITTQPALYGKPLQARLAAGSGTKSASLNAVLDHRQEPGSDKFSFVLKGVPVKDYKFGSEDSLSIIVGGGTATVYVDAAFEKGLLDAK